MPMIPTPGIGRYLTARRRQLFWKCLGLGPQFAERLQRHRCVAQMIALGLPEWRWMFDKLSCATRNSAVSRSVRETSNVSVDQHFHLNSATLDETANKPLQVRE